MEIFENNLDILINTKDTLINTKGCRPVGAMKFVYPYRLFLS